MVSPEQRKRLRDILYRIDPNANSFDLEEVKAMIRDIPKPEPVVFPEIPQPEKFDYTHQLKTIELLRELSLEIQALRGIITPQDAISASLLALKTELQSEIDLVKRRTGASTYQSWTEETTTFDGSSNTFTLKYIPKTNSLHLYLQGVYQQANNDYTISGTTITFTLGAADLNGMTAVANYPT